MAPAEFTGVVAPKQGDSKPAYTPDYLSHFLKDSFKFSTIVTFGAVGQVALFALLPARYAIVPPAIVAINAVVKTLLQLRSPASNEFMASSIPGRVTAQLPDPESSRYGSQPAARPLVVFHLGVRYNHPLGIMAPGSSQVGNYLVRMNDDLMKRADEYGIMSCTHWSGTERATNNTFLLIYYFRDIDGVNKFARDPLHRECWDWFNKAGLKHVGIFHEAFCVTPKAYESVYVNMHPTLMGTADTKCVEEDTGEEKWVSPLVNSDHGPLKTQFGRMGRAFKEELRSL